MTNPQDPFSAPQSQLPAAPTLRTLGEGRLVAIVPLRLERGTPGYEAGKLQDKLTADVLVCDGAPFMFGGDPTKGLPDLVGPFPIPGVVKNMWIFSEKVIGQIPEDRIGKGVVLARLVKVPTKNGRTSWKLADPTDADKATALPVYQAYLAGQLAAPAPAGTAAAPQPTTMHMAPSAPAQQSGGQPMGVYPPQPQYAPQPAPQYVPTPAPPMADWTSTHPVPAGFSPEQWMGLAVEQRAQVLGYQGITFGQLGQVQNFGLAAMASNVPPL